MTNAHAIHLAYKAIASSSLGALLPAYLRSLFRYSRSSSFSCRRRASVGKLVAIRYDTSLAQHARKLN